MIFTKVKGLKGEISIPGDKSISHRAIMLGALADGTTEIHNFLNGADCLSTIDCFRKMGIEILSKNDCISVRGNGLFGLKNPSDILYTGNSGTTTRLMSGILAAQDFSTVIDGDASIRKRPMDRIITPLSLMNADISSLKNNNCAPLQINGKKLKGIHYNSPVASAQIKSAVLLAGLYAQGETSVTEPYVSRNHTELMFKHFGIDIKSDKTTATVKQASTFKGQKIIVPGDISSAAYFIVAGLITPNSEILIKNVGINPTRNGIITVAKKMGGNVTLLNRTCEGGEEVADILVKHSSLKGITIEGDIIPTLIDEIPAIAVMACFAQGTTTIKDAAELKVKETNRIDTVVNNLKLMNADAVSTDDGMIINTSSLKGNVIDAYFDHRIAMAFSIAGMNSDGETQINNFECVDISYPNFYDDLSSLA